MEKIIDILLNSFDLGYMLAVNILTYLIIKSIDSLNGPNKAVPTWLKRLIAVLSGILLGGIIYLNTGYSSMIIYSFIASLVTWDTIFKPIVKYFKNLSYNEDENT